jgi:hypothetical protein
LIDRLMWKECQVLEHVSHAAFGDENIDLIAGIE